MRNPDKSLPVVSVRRVSHLRAVLQAQLVDAQAARATRGAGGQCGVAARPRTKGGVCRSCRGGRGGADDAAARAVVRHEDGSLALADGEGLRLFFFFYKGLLSSKGSSLGRKKEAREREGEETTVAHPFAKS